MKVKAKCKIVRIGRERISWAKVIRVEERPNSKYGEKKQSKKKKKRCEDIKMKEASELIAEQYKFKQGGGRWKRGGTAWGRRIRKRNRRKMIKMEKGIWKEGRERGGERNVEVKGLGCSLVGYESYKYGFHLKWNSMQSSTDNEYLHISTCKDALNIVLR